jgi:hypothetical protein
VAEREQSSKSAVLALVTIGGQGGKVAFLEWAVADQAFDDGQRFRRREGVHLFVDVRAYPALGIACWVSWALRLSGR